jgi:hypothetical protein
MIWYNSQKEVSIHFTSHYKKYTSLYMHVREPANR